MSVKSINLNRTEVPLARAKDWGTVRATQATAATAPQGASDEAIVSERARQLAAALVGGESMPKLHLSPPELRALISPPEARPRATASNGGK